MTLDLDVEIFSHKAMIGALKARIESENDFIKRCQEKQKATYWKNQGLIPASTYNSLAWRKGTKKKKAQRRKKDVWHNFFCWSDPAMFPYTRIKCAEEKIAVLEIELAKFEELKKEKENE